MTCVSLKCMAVKRLGGGWWDVDGGGGRDGGKEGAAWNGQYVVCKAQAAAHSQHPLTF